MISKPTSNMLEVPTLFLRQAAAGAPAELVISHGGQACMVYRLRDSQLRQIAIEAPRMALSGFITSKLDR